MKNTCTTTNQSKKKKHRRCLEMSTEEISHATKTLNATAQTWNQHTYKPASPPPSSWLLSVKPHLHQAGFLSVRPTRDHQCSRRSLAVPLIAQKTCTSRNCLYSFNTAAVGKGSFDFSMLPPVPKSQNQEHFRPGPS